MIRLTVKDLKKAMRGLPDNALICMYSDSEGNSQSTALNYYVDIVGAKHVIKGTRPGEKDFVYIGGEEVFGVDLEKDKGVPILILVPSL